MENRHLQFYAVKILLFNLVLLPACLPTGKIEWKTEPEALTRTQGENMSLNWIVNIASHKLSTIKVWQRKHSQNFDVLFYNGEVKARGIYVNRINDLNLTAHQVDSILNITFFMANLTKITDEGEYLIGLSLGGNLKSSPNKTLLTILVPPKITNSPYTISATETEIVELYCNSTGFPTPKVNWTKNDIVIGVGNPYRIQATRQDNNGCYICVVFNGVSGARVMNVCLNVKYQFNWTTTPPASLAKLFGQSMKLVWGVDTSPSAFESAVVWQTKANTRKALMSYYSNGSMAILDQEIKNRSAYIELSASISGFIVTITFANLYLIKDIDEASYDVSVTTVMGNTNFSPSRTSVVINDKDIWTAIPKPSTKIQGQNVTMEWGGNFPYRTLQFAKVWRKDGDGDGKKVDVAFYKVQLGVVELRGPFKGRTGQINLTASQIRSLVRARFEMKNLSKTTDDGEYHITLTYKSDIITAPNATLLTIKVPPSITSFHPYIIYANETQIVQLVCNSTGFPLPTVNWTRNGVVIGKGNPFRIQVTPQDHNRCYTCVVFNGVYGAKMANVCLTVQYKPISTRFSHSPSQRRFCIGSTTIFRCNATSKPSAEYSLYLDGDLLQGRSTSGTFNVSLSKKGENNFTCVPKNTAGIGEEKSINFFVSERPVIKLTPRSVTIAEGQSLTLSCNSSGTPATNITWYGTGGNVIHRGDTLHINSVKREDEGSYRCVARGEECNSDSAVALVVVYYGVNITTEHSQVITVNESSSLNLVCKATGKPTPNINWTRDGVLVETGSPFSTPLLNHNDNTACYTCIAYNGIQEVKTANYCLNVQYPPRSASLTIDRKTVCQNDSVNMICLSGPANPAPSRYNFYYNGYLVQSSSNFKYASTVLYGSPQENRYTCVPINALGKSIRNATVSVVAKVAPRVNQLNNHPSIAEGSRFDLKCNVSGTSPLNITWKRTGKPDFQGQVYTFSSISRHDGGFYYCLVTNGDECPSLNASVNVNVHYKPESTTLRISPSLQRFCQGNITIMNCSASAKPPAEYSLYHNGQRMQGKSTTGRFTVALKVKGINYFTCLPNNIIGRGPNKTIMLFVVEPPTIVISPKSRYIQEGKRLLLFCNASSFPQSNITWYKNGENAVQHGDTFSINVVKRGDEGSYRCVVNNGEECNTASSVAVVTVQYPAVITSPDLTVTVNESKYVQLFCNATGKPLPSIAWMRDGKRIHNGSLYTTPPLSYSDNNACYTCMASNSVGTLPSTKKYCLNVQYKPRNTSLFIVQSTVCHNDTVRMTCQSNSANPSAASYRFLYNDVTVQDSLSNVFIANAITAAPGLNKFTCLPRNPLGDAIENATVNVFAKVMPIITKITSNQVVVEGSSLTLTCAATGTLPITITWTKSRKSDFQGSEYPLPTINRNDQGTYRCIVTNGAECPSKTASVNVTVNYKPENTTLQPSLSRPVLNEEITLTCTSHANPSPSEYKIFRNAELVYIGSTGIHVLRISQRGRNLFFCIAQNVVGNTSSPVVSLDVQYAPRIIGFPPTNVTLYHNDQLSLTCQAEGNPVPNVTWTWNDNPRIIGRQSGLQLNAAESLPGKYKCSVSNRIGSVKTLAFYVNVAACQNHKCQNGTCIALGTTYSCRCHTEFNGRNCEMHACKGHLCKHNAKCVSTTSGYLCICSRGLKGTYCDDEDRLHVTFVVTLVITKPEWVAAYEDEKSREFKDLENRICGKLYFESEVTKCNIISLSQGSIVAQTELTFKETKTESEVLSFLKNRTAYNKLGDIELQPSSLQVMAYSNPCTKEPCKFDGECQSQGNGFTCTCHIFRYGATCEKGIGIVPGIILIVIIIFSLLFAIFLILNYFWRHSRSETDSTDDLKRDIKMSSMGYDSAFVVSQKIPKPNHIYYGREVEEPAVVEHKEIENGCINESLSEPGPGVLCYRI